MHVFCCITLERLDNEDSTGQRILEVCGYSRTRGFTRTRGSGTGRVGASRVGSGTAKLITSTGVPGFTRTDVKFWCHIITATYSSKAYYMLVQRSWHILTVQ